MSVASTRLGSQTPPPPVGVIAICMAAALGLGVGAALQPHMAIVAAALLSAAAGVAVAAVIMGPGVVPRGEMLRGISSGRLTTSLLFMVCLTYSWSGLWRGPQGLRIVDGFILILLVMGLRHGYKLRHRYFAVAMLAMGLFAGGTLLASQYSDDHAGDAVALFRSGFVLAVIPLVLVHTVTTTRRMNIALTGLVLSAVTSTVAAVAHRSAGIWLLPVPIKPVFDGTREYGLGGHPLYLGMVACTGIAVAVALALRSSPSLRPVGLLCIPFLLIGVALSATRGPFIGLAAAGAILLVGLAAQRRHALTPFYGIGVLLVLAVLSVFPDSVARLSEIGTTDRSTTTRLTLYDESMSDIFANPFAGYGANLVKGAGGLEGDIDYTVVEGTVDERFAAHNVWIQTWLATGMLGVAALAVATGAPLIAAAQVMRTGTRSDRVLALAFVAALAATLVSTMFYSVVFDREVWLIPALMIALWANHRGEHWNSETDGQTRS